MVEVEFAKGLEGVIAAESKICRIDGEKGELYYMGYSIRDLVEHSTFEEVTYLLLFGELPTPEQLLVFSAKMRGDRHLPEPVRAMIRDFPQDAHPMELLQSAVHYLSGYAQPKIQHGPDCNCRDTLHQIAQLATVVATYQRFKEGKEYLPPRTDLSQGANFLYMLRGEEPDRFDGEIMDKALILHAEHSFNASTFTARVVASTMSTCYCSVSAAIGALYGSLHGGANERVTIMVDEIGAKDNAGDWVHRALDDRQRIMGMGHRVYHAKDPRSIVMEEHLRQLGELKGDCTYYDILKEVESTFRDRMEEKGKPIYPNVDFFSGSVYRLLGIPRLLFTPIFAMARTAGWLSHILEQRVDNRIFRPKALYTGHEKRSLTPIEER